MLIIFDLDDTLIDTSGCIISKKLEDAVHKMVDVGLILPNLDEAIERIRRLDSEMESAKHTLIKFLELYQADAHFLEIGAKEVYENISTDLPIFTTEGAIDVLNELKQNHQLALVTIGRPALQFHKMKKAGIDSGIFSKIVVCESNGKVCENNAKKPYYQAIVSELGFPQSEVLVCGDRIKNDLTPAKELGFKTVHMRWGRGLNCFGSANDVDHSIWKLSEIKTIIKNLMNISSF